MKRFRLLVLMFPLLISVPLWFAKEKRNSRVEYLLLKYPKNNGLKILAAQHGMNYIREEGDFLASYFVGGDTRRVQEVVGGSHFSGSKITYYSRNVTLYRNHRSIKNDVSSKDIANLLEQLPPSKPPKKHENILFISFYRNETRLYDRANLPQVVRDIFKITGAPLEELPQ